MEQNNREGRKGGREVKREREGQHMGVGGGAGGREAHGSGLSIMAKMARGATTIDTSLGRFDKPGGDKIVERWIKIRIIRHNDNVEYKRRTGKETSLQISCKLHLSLESGFQGHVGQGLIRNFIL